MPELPEWNQPEARFGAANSVGIDFAWVKY